MSASAPTLPTVTVPLESNYWELYPRREEIAFGAIRQVSEGLGVRFSLKTGLRDLSHYLVAQDDEAPREIRDGEVTVRFRRLGDGRPQHATAEIRAVSSSGGTTRPHRITVGYYPREFYAASGQTSPSWVIVGNTDVSVARTAVEDWIVDRPPETDRAYAEKQWGDRVRGGASEHEKARILAREIMTALQPHGGVPSDAMRNAPPFEQYERAVSGRDHVWCGNHAAIFSWACNALGIPARRIGMNHLWSSDGDHNLLMAEGHSTTEIFDETLNRWVWIDLTFQILGAYLLDRDPVNMAELVQFLNDGSRIRVLSIVEYDPATREEKRLPAETSGKRAALLKYYKRDQRFRYTRLQGEAG